jgi:hypothetical protein
MGEFLSTPIRDKVSEDNENAVVSYQRLLILFFLNIFSLDTVQ